MASSPYAKQGVLWDTFKRHYGPDGAPLVLVAKGTTRDFNQTIPQEEIDRELARDRARNAAELLAEFRSDLEGYISLEAVEACVGSYYEIPPAATTTYYAFTDPSSGANDSFTLAIAHRDGERAIIDCIRETKPPFSPEAVIAEYAALLKRYHVPKVVRDRYGGEFPREQFRRRNVLYEPSKRYCDSAPSRAYSLSQHRRSACPRRQSHHAIVDNYAVHKHPKVRQWLAHHPRWASHFTPTSANVSVLRHFVGQSFCAGNRI